MTYRTFCLCLPEYPDQIEAAKKHFAEMEVGPVEFFWGFNAVAAGVATTHTYEVDHPGSGYKMGPKPTGIWLSHWMLWNHLMRLQDEYFLVLETDAKFSIGWKEKLERALKVVPSNFDFLHIGSCCMEGHPKTHLGEDVYETKHAQCTHAFIVRRGCLPFVLGTLRKVWAPIDIQLVFEVFPSLNTYAIHPMLATQFNTIIPP